MSTTTSDPRLTEYSPSSPTTDFPVLFPLFSINDLGVFIDAVQVFDFTLSANFTFGVSTDAVVKFTNGKTGHVQIIGRRSPRRPQRFTEGKTVPVDDFNLAFDVLTAEVQELRRDIDETLPAFEGNNESQRPIFVTSIAQLKAVDTGESKSAVLLMIDATGQAEASTPYYFRTDKDYSANVTADAGANLYVKANDTDSSVGAWVGSRFPSPPVIDGTRPLKYSDFYRWKGKDHNAASAAAFDAMLNSSGTNPYKFFLDFEGATVTLEEPVVPSGGSTNFFYVQNARFVASSGSWAGDYLMDLATLGGGPNMRFTNCIFDGNLLAHWIVSDAAAVELNFCRFDDNRDEAMPGIDMQGGAHIKMYGGTRLTSPDGSVNPNVRNRIGLRCAGGDQKVFNSIFNYFKYGMIFEAFGNTIGNCHVYQGTGELLTGHTAGIKFTSGQAGSIVSDIYLDKCFIEISNETDLDELEIGGVVIDGVHTALQCDDTGFAFVQARDYGGHTGTCFVTRVTIKNGEFRNLAATTVRLTKLYNPTAFDVTKNDDILVSGNSFHNVAEQANPCTNEQTFTASTAQAMDFAGLLPFGSNPRNVTHSPGTQPSSGAGQTVDVNNFSGSVVNLKTATNWAGNLTVTATLNQKKSNGMIVS